MLKWEHEILNRPTEQYSVEKSPLHTGFLPDITAKLRLEWAHTKAMIGPIT